MYKIVEGNGMMHTGLPEKNNNVKWHNVMRVKKGDCFTINEADSRIFDHRGKSNHGFAVHVRVCNWHDEFS